MGRKNTVEDHSWVNRDIEEWEGPLTIDFSNVPEHTRMNIGRIVYEGTLAWKKRKIAEAAEAAAREAAEKGAAKP